MATAKKLDNKIARELLANVEADHVLEHGQLFSRLDADEPVVWRVLEAIDTDEGRRVTFHLYYRDVFIKTVIGLLTPDNRVQWGVRHV